MQSAAPRKSESNCEAADDWLPTEKSNEVGSKLTAFEEGHACEGPDIEGFSHLSASLRLSASVGEGASGKDSLDPGDQPLVERLSS